MKIVNPDLTTNTIKFIPRINNIVSAYLELVNETTKEETVFVFISFTYLDGVFSFDLDFDFKEGDKYGFKCYFLDEVYYRGEIFATTQEPQNYELSKDLYYYE